MQENADQNNFLCGEYLQRKVSSIVETVTRCPVVRGNINKVYLKNLEKQFCVKHNSDLSNRLFRRY